MSAYGWPQAGPAQPGMVPLRPLSVGELLSVGVKVAWRNVAVLAPLALLVSALALAVQIGWLAATGYLGLAASGNWAVLAPNPTNAEIQTFLNNSVHIFTAIGASALLTLLLSGVVGGPAATGAAEATVDPRPGPRAALTRLRGRWGVVVGTGALYGLIQMGGFILLVVPGILALVFLLPAVPVAALEGGTPASAMRRAASLSRGFRPRLFGVYLLAALFGGIASYVVTSIFTGLTGNSSTSDYLLIEGVSVVLAAFVTPWSATVIALLYIDIRFRKEGLAHSLAAAANRA